MIDLQATEVESAPAPADPPTPEVRPAHVTPPVSDPPPVHAAQVDASPMPESPFIPPTPEQPKVEQPQPAAASPAPEPPKAAPSPGAPPPSQPKVAWLPEGFPWPQAGSAAAGAAGGFVLFLVLWLFGAFGGGQHEPVVDLSPKLAAIEKQLNDLAARPLPAAGADPRSVEDVAARVTRIEAAQAAPRAPVTDPVVLGRLTASEQAVKSMADNVAALSRRSETVEGALRDGQRDTQARIDKLAAAVEELRTAVRQASAGSDRAARLAAATTALRAAIERGDSFTAEFAVVKPLVQDAAVLSPLEPYVTSGVPRHFTLAHELAALVKPLLLAAEPPRDGGFLDRLQANAEKLVRVRPVGEAAGDDRAAVLARIDARAAQGNISGAVAEIAKLPPDARAPFQPWLAKVEARDRAIDAGRKLAADSVAALRAH